jgi:hypothetical protein
VQDLRVSGNVGSAMSRIGANVFVNVPRSARPYVPIWAGQRSAMRRSDRVACRRRGSLRSPISKGGAWVECGLRRCEDLGVDEYGSP